MRNFSVLFSTTIVAVITAIAACTPYDPTLPATPFSCGSADPKCPDGYTCMTDMTSGRALCEAAAGTLPDAGGPSSCADDHTVEPNDTPQSAYPLPQPLPQNPFTLAGLAICPATDKDNYEVNVPTNGTQTLEVVMTYDAGGAVLTMTVLNSGDSPISSCPGPDCTVTSNTVDFKLANAALGNYIVQILGPGTTTGAGSGENNYKLTFSID